MDEAQRIASAQYQVALICCSTLFSPPTAILLLPGLINVFCVFKT